MATGPVLVPELLPPEIIAGSARPDSAVHTDNTSFGHFLEELDTVSSMDMYAESLAWMERHLITKVLTDVNGNQSKAAERLGITRGSLRHKIRALAISIDHVVSSDE